jgi:hypothetical protein
LEVISEKQAEKPGSVDLTRFTAAPGWEARTQALLGGDSVTAVTPPAWALTVSGSELADGDVVVADFGAEIRVYEKKGKVLSQIAASQTFRGKRGISGSGADRKHAPAVNFTPAKILKDGPVVVTPALSSIGLLPARGTRLFYQTSTRESYTFLGRVGGPPAAAETAASVDPWSVALTPEDAAKASALWNQLAAERRWLWIATIAKYATDQADSGAISKAVGDLLRANGVRVKTRHGSGTVAGTVDLTFPPEQQNQLKSILNPDTLHGGSASFKAFAEHADRSDSMLDYFDAGGARLNPEYIQAFLQLYAVASHMYGAGGRGRFLSKPTTLGRWLYQEESRAKRSTPATGVPATSSQEDGEAEPPRARFRGERKPSWDSPVYLTVDVVEGAQGKTDAWHNVYATIGGKRVRYGYNNKRWARGQEPPPGLLAEVVAHGYGALFGEAAASDADETTSEQTVTPDAGAAEPPARMRMPADWDYLAKGHDPNTCAVCGREAGGDTYIRADIEDNTVLDVNGDQQLPVGSVCKRKVPARFLVDLSQSASKPTREKKTEPQTADGKPRLYHVVLRNQRTGMDTYLSAHPMVHSEATTFLSKVVPLKKGQDHLLHLLVETVDPEPNVHIDVDYLRFFLWRGGHEVPPENLWLAQFTPEVGKPLFLMPLDPGDFWAHVGPGTLAADWREVSAVPRKVLDVAKTRLPEESGSAVNSAMSIEENRAHLWKETLAALVALNRGWKADDNTAWVSIHGGYKTGSNPEGQRRVVLSQDMSGFVRVAHNDTTLQLIDPIGNTPVQRAASIDAAVKALPGLVPARKESRFKELEVTVIDVSQPPFLPGLTGESAVHAAAVEASKKHDHDAWFTAEARTAAGTYGPFEGYNDTGYAGVLSGLLVRALGTEEGYRWSARQKAFVGGQVVGESRREPAKFPPLLSMIPARVDPAASTAGKSSADDEQDVAHISELGLSIGSPVQAVFAAAQPRVNAVLRRVLSAKEGDAILAAAHYIYGALMMAGWLKTRGYDTGSSLGFVTESWNRWPGANRGALPDPIGLKSWEDAARSEAALVAALDQRVPDLAPWTAKVEHPYPRAEWEAAVQPVTPPGGARIIGQGSGRTRIAAVTAALTSASLWREIWRARLAVFFSDGEDAIGRLRAALAPEKDAGATLAPATRGLPVSSAGSRDPEPAPDPRWAAAPMAAIRARATYPWIAPVLSSAERSLGVKLQLPALGQGANGQVFAVQGNPAQVVKITAEANEVRALLRLQDQPQAVVARVYAVARLGPVTRSPDYPGDPVEGYAILREAVTPLSEAAARNLHLDWTGPPVVRKEVARYMQGQVLKGYQGFPSPPGWAPGDAQEKRTPGVWASDAAFALNYWKHKGDRKAVMQSWAEFHGWMSYINSYGAGLTHIAMLRALKAAAVNGAFADFGPHNLGQRADGEFCWFDLHYISRDDAPTDPVDLGSMDVSNTESSRSLQADVEARLLVRADLRPYLLAQENTLQGATLMVKRALDDELVDMLGPLLKQQRDPQRLHQLDALMGRTAELAQEITPGLIARARAEKKAADSEARGGLWDDADVISQHTQADALASAQLFDLNQVGDQKAALAKEAGFTLPVFITSAAYQATIKMTPAAARAGNDVAGRAWDVLSVLAHTLKRASVNGESTRRFAVHAVTDRVRPPSVVQLKAVIGPGDEGQPTVTVMLPDED